MEPLVPSRLVFRFGLFEADPSRNMLTRDGARVRIQEQPFRVLLLLLERPNTIVTREELRQKLWPVGTHVDFEGSLNVIIKKLRATIKDDPDNPRFVETVPRHGYRFIAPVTVQNGAATNQSRPPASAPSTTGSDEVPESASPASSPRSLRIHRLILTGAAVVLLVASLAGSRWLVLHGRSSPASLKTNPEANSEAVPIRKSIAVLGFHNASGKPEDLWLGTALSEMLRTELAGGDKLRLVSGEDVANLRLRTPWPQTDTFDRSTTARIGGALGSDLLVLGSYTVVGNSPNANLRVDVRLQEAKTGEILSEVSETGHSQDVFRIVSSVGATLRDRLGVPALATRDEAGVLASMPLDRDAARFYSLGLAKLHESDAIAARDLLEQAVRADPKFSLAHAMLGRAYGQLGYEEKRKEEAKKAWELSGNLPQAERMTVEGDYFESLADHEKAASTLHALFELFPDNVDYGLQLAAVQVAAGKSSEALETLKRLRQLPSPASDDPRIDLEEAKATPNDKSATLVLVREAMRKAKAQGKELVFARARKEECMALAYTDHLEEANASCQDAYNLFESAGNRLAAADALRLMGDVEGTKGHYQQAIATYQRALRVLLELGEHEKTGAVCNNMAINLENQGKLDEAEELYRKAKAHFDQAGDRANSSTALANIADILYLRGKLPEAEKFYQQTIDIRSSMESLDAGYALYRLADLRLAQGQPEEARRLAEQSVKIYRAQQGNYQYLTGAMIVLGEVMQAEDDLEGARAQFQETIEIRRKMGEEELVSESQTELASVLLDEGKPTEAESLLRAAIVDFEKEQADPDTMFAYTSLSKALADQGKLSEARAAIGEAVKLVSHDASPAARLSLLMQSANLETAGANGEGGPPVEHARRQLRSVMQSAQKLGYYQIECEGRLALGEMEMQQSAGRARTQLLALESEARGRGLKLLANKVHLALESPRSSMIISR